MSNENDDTRLEAAFDALRRDTASRQPDFVRMRDAAAEEASRMPKLGVVDGGVEDGSSFDRTPSRTRRRVARFGGWVSLAAAAGAAALLFVDGGVDPADAEFEALVSAYTADASAGAWMSPTAALLDIPGLDLGTVPDVGGALRATGGVDLPGRDS